VAYRLTLHGVVLSGAKNLYGYLMVTRLKCVSDLLRNSGKDILGNIVEDASQSGGII